MLAEARLAPPIHNVRSTDPGALGMIRILQRNSL